MTGALRGLQPAGHRPISNQPPMNLHELATVMAALGCPQHKVAGMAAQLDKRARQLAERKDRSYEEALTHLLGLMRQGWAAKENGVGL